MSIQEILNEEGIVSCGKEESLEKVAKMMKDKDVGAVLIMENEKALGIITDRDITLRSVAEGKSPSECKAHEIMSENITMVDQTEGLFQVIEEMSNSKCRRIVIVDDQQKPKGILSSGDVLKLLIEEMSMLSKILTPEADKFQRMDAAS